MTYYLWVWNDDLERWEIVWSSENDLEVLARKSEIEADKKYTEINTDSTTPPESPLGTPTYNYTIHCSVDSSQTAGLSSKTEYSIGDTLPPSEAGTCYDSEGNMGYWVVDSKSVTYPEPKERPSGNVIYVVYKKDGKYAYSRILDKYLDTWQHQLLDGGYIEEFVDYKNTEEEAKELVNSLQPEEQKIYGYVKDQDGNPIEGAKVSSGGINPTYTNSGGYYEYPTEPAVSIRIDVEKEGYNSISEWVDVGTEDVRKDFVLTKEVEAKHNRIYGTVTDKALGTPISLAAVTFEGKTAYTGNDGKYEIKDVFASGQIVCSATGYKTATEFIEAPSEGDLEVNFELEREEEKELKQKVKVSDQIEMLGKLGIKGDLLGDGSELKPYKLPELKPDYVYVNDLGKNIWVYTQVKADPLGRGVNGVSGSEKEIKPDETFEVKDVSSTWEFAMPAVTATGIALSPMLAGLATKVGAVSTGIAGAGLTLKDIAKGIVGAVGTVIFAEFICEEAVQTAGMGVYIAKGHKDRDVLKAAIDNYERIYEACYSIHNVIKVADPIGGSFDAFYDAAKASLIAYKKMLMGNTLEVGKSYTVYVKEVIDGDTLSVYYDNEKYSIRLYGINAPEHKYKEGKDAREYLKRLIEGREVGILVVDVDAYNRNVCKVAYNGTDISEEMVKAGWAYAWADEYKGYEEDARINQIGMFKGVEELSKTDILKAYREELIDEDTAKKKLKNLNYSDEDIEIMLNLTAKEKLGKLRVTSSPTYAQIIINDKPTNLLTSETMYLPAGTYAVTVSLEGYKTPAAKEVEVEEEKTAEVHFDLERMKIGYLYIRSRPSQAAIYINGVDTKLLTPQKFELEEGKYKIMLRYRGYEDREIEVEIKENETVEKYIRLVRKAE